MKWFSSVYLLLLISLKNKMINGECRQFTNIKNYEAADLEGKYYLIAMVNGGFYMQQFEDACVAMYSITKNDGETWNFKFDYQLPNGVESVADLLWKKTSNQNVFHISDYEGKNNVDFMCAVIAADAGKFFMAQSCNTKTGKEAVWINYYKQVQGLNSIDDPYLGQIKEALAINHIAEKELITVKQRNCTENLK